MERKINYNLLFEKQLDLIKNCNEKPRLLLHACCGPCFTIPYEKLKDYFDITIMYNNSNIYPRKEHDRRLNELKKYINEIEANINIVEEEYDNDNFNLDLQEYAEQSEGHERCRICFRKRLRKGFEYAKNHGFDYFGTVMTISRYKNAQDINKIGIELEQEFSPVKWLKADFKKNNGYEDSLILIRDHKMYFQEYCGCKFSYQKYLEKLKKLEEK